MYLSFAGIIIVYRIFLKKSTSGAAQYFTIPESYGLSNCSHKNRISRGLTDLSFISLIVIHPPVINNYIKKRAASELVLRS